MTEQPTRTDGRSIGSIAALVTALLIAIFAFQLNASMLSPVLATMQKELDTTSAQIGVTQTAFFASAALFSLFLPRWADLVGRKRIMIGMLAVTALGCVLSALAPNVGLLGIGRVVQGVAGPVVPMALIMLHVQVPDNRRYAKFMAVLTAINGGIAGVDALAGGWLAGHLGFRSVFWTMAVICALGVVAIAVGTVESKAPVTQPMDWLGVVFLVGVLAALYFAFDEAGKLADARWVLVAVLFVVAIVAFVIFWNIEKRSRHPLVTTSYMRQRRTWALLLTTLLTMTGVFAIMNGLIPNFAQDSSVGPGIATDAVSWWTLTPYAIAGLIMGPIAGQLASRFGYRQVLRVGLALTVVSLVVAALTTGLASPAVLLAVSIAVGVTYAGICNIMLNGLGIVLSPADNEGYLPGMNASAFNLGAGLSFAILFAVNTAVTTAVGPIKGYSAAMFIGAALLLAALATSWLIPRPAEQREAA